MTAFAPFLEGRSGHRHRIRSFRPEPRIPVNILIDRVLIPRPITPEQYTGVEVNNVRFESKTRVWLGPGPLQLMVPGESKDVVAQQVRLTIVLVKATVGRSENQVAFDLN